MTTAAIQDRVDELFADARNVHAQAIERLQNGDTTKYETRPSRTTTLTTS